MSELPKGWVEVEWNQITATDGFRRGPFGGNLKKDCFVDDGYAVYEQYAPINDDCNSFRYFITEDKYNELSGFHVGHGDFLISCSGTMGKITHVPKGAPKGVINQALLRIRLQDNFVQPDYFLRLFRSPTLQGKVLNKVVGGAIQNLAAVAELKKIKLPVAPINEQTRIVEKLDEVLAQVDTIKVRLDGIPAILKRFRQSVLAAAVSGRLTEEWRQNSDYLESEINLAKRNTSISVPKSWNTYRLDDVCDIFSGNAFKSQDLQNEGDIPVIKISNVQYGKFEVKNQQYLPLEYLKSYKKYAVYPDDLLMALTRPITNETLKVCRYPDLGVVALLNQRVCKFNFINDDEKSFFEILFQSSYFKDQVEDNLSETLQPNLSPRDLSKFLVFMPPIDEQKEIVRLVDQYFAFADTIEAQVKKAQARVDNLTQSILAKAFRGELVAQDPDDEPAEKLLERIAQARKEAEALAKAAKKVIKKSNN